MNTIVDWARAYKQGWTQDRFYQGNFRNEDHTAFCFIGYGMTLPTWGREGVLGQQAFLREVERKLIGRGFPECRTIIANVNDGENGYETLMDVIDEILVENMPKEAPTAPTRELVYA